MKIAIAGKGGVGKTTVSALLCWAFKETGAEVLAVDADPDPNLGFLLGFPDYENIEPIVKMKGLIKERMGIKEDNPILFRLNPRVDDIPDKFMRKHNGIKLIVMGTVKGGDSGCVCPENTFLKRILGQIVLRRNEHIIVDFEAGVEHLGRGIASKFDHLIIVVEPTKLSFDSFRRIYPLAKDIGIKKIWTLINRVRSKADLAFVNSYIDSKNRLGVISYSDSCVRINQTGNWAQLKKDKVYQEIKEAAGVLLKS